MLPTGSISGWLDQLKAGNREVAQALWARYFPKLMALARKHLQAGKIRMADEEDLALSAFASFFRLVDKGNIPQLEDRHDLWKLLLTITQRKICHWIRDQGRQKRGGGQVLGESILEKPPEEDAEAAGLDQVVGEEPTPEFAAALADQFQHLFGILDEGLRVIAVLKMEGYSSQEIAERQNCALRTVERKLRLIRTLWEKDVQS